MDLVLTDPYVMYLVGLVVLIILYKAVVPRLPNLSAAGGAGSPALERLLSTFLGSRYAEGKMLRAVSRYKKDGHYLMAGKVLEEAERFQEAVDAYQEGKEFYAAASTLERMGKLEKAAELYLQAGDYKKAAQIFTEAGKPNRAAVLFLEKGNSLEAARLFGVAGAWDKAGDLYAKSGYPLRAAEAFEKTGDYLRAAEAYEKHYMENVSYGSTYSATSSGGADQKSALQAGRLYEMAHDPNRALQIYTRGGYFKEAAVASLGMGQHAKAAELFLRAEDPRQAADAYERAGDKVKAANLRGEVALKEERVPEAAALFQKGEDYLRAAELFESAGLLAQAAGAYEAGNSYAAAGGVYIRAGLPDRAAASYERANDYETAAKLYDEAGRPADAIRLYEKAGLTFKSGEAAARAGDRDRAISLLQQVPPSDENYRAAVVQLSRLFVESGRAALAVERLHKVLGSEPISVGNLDLYYWLAAAQERLNPLEALSTYKKIQAESLTYSDVHARVMKLEATLAAGGIDRRGTAAVPPGAPVAAPPPPAAVSPPPPPVTPAVAPPVAAPAPETASKGARFTTREEVGRGPLGTVFRAEDKLDGRNVALRVLPEALLANGVLASLAADLKAAAQLSHPNGVKVLGLVEREGQRCVISEFVAGRSVAEALKAGHKMTVQQAHSLGRVLAQYLAFVHGRGLVHGSIQPSNVMVASGVVKIADLGLCRLVQRTPPTPLDYRAPEGGFDTAGDLYALSALLYHFVTGVHPKSQAQGPALPLPSTLSPGVPEALDKLLLRSLHPRPEVRLGSAEEMLHELKDMVRLA
jgi:eukaryotic-like serine/threonine-protein kinase